MSLALYDTATQAVSEFVPIQPGKVGIYVCGATVQSAPHVGHLRPAVAFDILRRWLTYNNYEVTLIRNVTDIDDKILAKAQEAGREWWAHAYANEQVFTQAYDALNVIRPTYEPRATGHVPEMIELMQTLIDNGHAYATGPGNVWFDVLSWPQYGELTRQKLADLVPEEAIPSPTRLSAQATDVAQTQNPGTASSAVESVETDSAFYSGVSTSSTAGVNPELEKHSPYDFALWKAPRAGEPETAAWETPWGRGRPGWHLECSAMAGRYLGPEFDIHGGGLDLRFPHHENEQAQSRAAGRPFARRWMHSAWITKSGEKMAKSLGNGLLVSDLLAEADPAVVRYAIASAHYRSMLEWSDTTLEETNAAWRRITNFIERAADSLRGAESHTRETFPAVEQVETIGKAELPDAFVAAMNDDLNVPAALAVVHEYVRNGNKLLDSQAPDDEIANVVEKVRAMLHVLGLDPLDEHWHKPTSNDDNALTKEIENLIELRNEARKAKNWAEADRIRVQITALGVAIEDSPSGTRWTRA